ncbi:alcohol dehydrogenase [Paenarthrobacter nitroguajacolicus]|nr:alcohol dehydrogenase [Paenarthrobacter nitroguajacolicus]
MSAAVFHRFGPPDVLEVQSMPVPEISPREVLVRVAAVGVGRLLDLVARAGKHPYAKFNLPHILGAEHAGTVVAIGSEVEGDVCGTIGSVRVGDRVAVYPGVSSADDVDAQEGRSEFSPALSIIGTHRPGAYAEYCAVPASNVFVVPPGMSPADAVAVINGGAVAMNQFDKVGGIRPGQRVLVQGASSALGSTTALLAKHLGAEVIATSRSSSKRKRLRELGLETLDVSDGSFAEDVRERFGDGGANLVVDNLGQPEIWQKNFEVLASGGSVVTSGAFLGREVTINLQQLYSRNQRIVGVRTGNLESAAKVWQEASRGFRSVVDRSFPFAQASEAHRYIENGGNVGRVQLAVG